MTRAEYELLLHPNSALDDQERSAAEAAPERSA